MSEPLTGVKSLFAEIDRLRAELTAARAQAGELAGALVAVREHVYCQNDYTTRDYDKYHAAVEQMNQALASYRAAHPEPEVTK